MTITPHDLGTFLVESRSRPDGVEAWLVDLQYLDEGWRNPRPVCSCPDCFAKDYHVCKHIIATVEHEKRRLGL